MYFLKIGEPSYNRSCLTECYPPAQFQCCKKNLLSIGWKPFFQQQIGVDLPSDAKIARVAAHYGSRILLLGSDGEFSIPAQLAESAGEVAVGDWLVLDRDDRAIQRLERRRES